MLPLYLRVNLDFDSENAMMCFPHSRLDSKLPLDDDGYFVAWKYNYLVYSSSQR